METNKPEWGFVLTAQPGRLTEPLTISYACPKPQAAATTPVIVPGLIGLLVGFVLCALVMRLVHWGEHWY